MKHMYSLFCVAIVACMPMLSVHAQEGDDGVDEGGLSWNAAVTSDYRFRGVSQTDEKPALQLGVDYGFANGVYVGGWASNVDFGDSTEAEVDTYIGWNRDLADSVNLDLQLVRYNYINEPADTDYAYAEFIGKLTFNDQYGVELGYTNDYYNADLDSLYTAVDGSWELRNGFNLTAAAGYTMVSGSDNDDYADFSVGVNRDFGPVNASLNYVGTDSHGKVNFGETADETVVLTIGAEF